MEHITFDILSELPLFYGIGHKEMEDFIRDVPYRIRNFNPGDTLAMQDQSCSSLFIPFKGVLSVQTYSDNKRYSFQEFLQAPVALQPESLYGIAPRYTHTYTAQTEVRALILPKDSVTTLFREIEIFRLNTVNLLATKIYRLQKKATHDLSGNTSQRIVRFIINHASYPAGEKTLFISMSHLAIQLNDTRLNISLALREMERKGLVLLQRRKIIVPALEKLIKNI